MQRVLDLLNTPIAVVRNAFRNAQMRWRNSAGQQGDIAHETAVFNNTFGELLDIADDFHVEADVVEAIEEYFAWVDDLKPRNVVNAKLEGGRDIQRFDPHVIYTPEVYEDEVDDEDEFEEEDEDEEDEPVRTEDDLYIERLNELLARINADDVRNMFRNAQAEWNRSEQQQADITHQEQVYADLVGELVHLLDQYTYDAENPELNEALEDYFNWKDLLEPRLSGQKRKEGSGRQSFPSSPFTYCPM